jgi:hypothetical protein
VGYYTNLGSARKCVLGGPALGPGTHAHPLVEHWNGKNWSLVTVPWPAGVDSGLTSLSSVSARDIWAAGNISSGGRNLPLIEHWNGSRWRIIPIAGQNPKHRTLLGIDALGASDVWAVGQYWPPTTSHYWGEKTLIEHWNGSRWSVVPSPNSECHQNDLVSVGMLSPDDGWAFGGGNHCIHGASSVTLLEHWNGHFWEVVGTSPPVWQKHFERRDPPSPQARHGAQGSRHV